MRGSDTVPQSTQVLYLPPLFPSFIYPILHCPPQLRQSKSHTAVSVHTNHHTNYVQERQVLQQRRAHLCSTIGARIKRQSAQEHLDMHGPAFLTGWLPMRRRGWASERKTCFAKCDALYISHRHTDDEQAARPVRPCSVKGTGAWITGSDTESPVASPCRLGPHLSRTEGDISCDGINVSAHRQRHITPSSLEWSSFFV